MDSYSLAHLSDSTLLQSISALVARDRANTAQLVAHIGEGDARKLYLGAGYPSMHEYCVKALHLSDASAYRRITAAREARKFPRLFTDLAEGRLHLSAVSVLAGHLTVENADELIVSAAGLTTREVELLISERFSSGQSAPRTPSLRAMRIKPVRKLLARGVETRPASQSSHEEGLFREQAPAPAAVAASLAAWFHLSAALPKSTHDKLRQAQDLLGHSVPSGDLVKVLDRVLDLALAELHKRKFATTDRPRAPRKSQRIRHIPSAVKRAVRKRDQGRCTYVSPSAQRCASRKRIEFDHIQPVARGGRASVDNIRLRCRAHNQYEAERTFGATFMNEKRRAASPT